VSKPSWTIVAWPNTSACISIAGWCFVRHDFFGYGR
ncbi:hypothetical protein A2U01_0090997, partial [Trifolium medium]|nr:hypothetical protein [Trifolium medium]